MMTNLKYFSLLFIFSAEVKYEDLKSPIVSREHAPCDHQHPQIPSVATSGYRSQETKEFVFRLVEKIIYKIAADPKVADDPTFIYFERASA
jgi:hypothetical protein